jgi:amidohydrolase
MTAPSTSSTIDLVDLRHDLHRIPEIGMDLPKTQALVLEALSELDLEVTTGQHLSSVTAVLRGGAATAADRDRPTVLLRGDMDALPVTEEVDLDFRSTIDGHMHACGHDQHMAMLVGAIHRLHAERDRLPGDVVCMFQPGEEGYDGAAAMIHEGVLDAAGRRPDAAWALHVMSGRHPRGEFTGRGGPMLSASNELHVVVRGRGGHGSAPERAADPIPAAAEMVTGLQTVLTRVVSPFDPAVVTVGEFHAGSRPNVIPEVARFSATVRVFDEDVLDVMERALVRYCEHVARAHGVTTEVVFDRQYPVTVNDPSAVDVAARVVADTLGEPGTPAHHRWMEMPNPTAGSEDFSRVLQAVPGAMLFLGACLEGRDYNGAPDNHAPGAAFDDSVLDDGAAVLAGLARRTLTSRAA